MKAASVLLRVSLTMLLALTGLVVGILLTPGLARFGAGPNARAIGQPDWGGGRMSFAHRPATQVIDSLRGVLGTGRSLASAWSNRTTGVVLCRKPDSDFALALVLSTTQVQDRAGLFELPSARQFRDELFPRAGAAQAPAADIPFYPGSDCRLQVGQGTACFVGFYLTPDSPEAVMAFYVRSLERLKWQRAAPTAAHVEAFAKPNDERTLVVQIRKQDSATTRIGLVAMTEDKRVGPK